MSEEQFASTSERSFGEAILRLMKENNRLLSENNALLKESIGILKQDHTVIASIDENVRKIKINTN